LVQHFFLKAKDKQGRPNLVLPTRMLPYFSVYTWPGNVRELRNTVARHLALGELASLPFLPRAEPDEDVSSSSPSSSDGRELAQVVEQALDCPLGEARQRVVEEFERRYIQRILGRHGGNVTRAAESAGIARRYFQVLKARAAK
jgi:DNA-binding NtrC family response regulator